jgi:transcriptional regulator with XRE-family HTH domain
MPSDEWMSQSGPEHDPLLWLRTLNDPVEAESFSESEFAELLAWFERIVRAEDLHHVQLSSKVLAAIAACIPDASVPVSLLARADERRQRVREHERESRNAAIEFRAQTPGELFRKVRERSGVAPEAAAEALGVSPKIYGQIEADRVPWHAIEVERLVALAAYANVTLSKLVLGLKLAVRQLLLQQIRLRAGFALSRADRSQDEAAARLDRLRAAFAMIKAENQRAAVFFKHADQIVTLSTGK